MGFRYAKRIRILPGVTLNVSKSGLGYSLGPKGMHYTKSPNGAWSRNIDLPGGFSHRTQLSGATKHKTTTAHHQPARQPAPQATAVASAPSPGMFSPGWEKDLFRALDKPDTFPAVAREHHAHPGVRVLCAALEGLWHYENLNNGTGDPTRARELLGWAAANGSGDLGAHPFVVKYLAQATWPVEIANGIVMHISLADDAALLAAAELHQAAGDLTAAIWVVEQADPTSASALSLAELYSDAGRDQDVIDLTTGITNDDDATALLLVLRGRAFAALGHPDAARESLKQALAPRSRVTEVRHRALLERSSVNLAQNRKAAARKDLETILAADPAYPGLADALAALPVA